MKTNLHPFGIFLLILLTLLVSASVFSPSAPPQESAPTLTPAAESATPPGMMDGIASWGIIIFGIVLLPALLALRRSAKP